jgi:hypothetical protein
VCARHVNTTALQTHLSYTYHCEEQGCDECDTLDHHVEVGTGWDASRIVKKGEIEEIESRESLHQPVHFLQNPANKLKEIQPREYNSVFFQVCLFVSFQQRGQWLGSMPTSPDFSI